MSIVHFTVSFNQSFNVISTKRVMRYRFHHTNKQFIVASQEISLPTLRSGASLPYSAEEALLPSIMAYAATFVFLR